MANRIWNTHMIHKLEKDCRHNNIEIHALRRLWVEIAQRYISIGHERQGKNNFLSSPDEFYKYKIHIYASYM